MSEAENYIQLHIDSVLLYGPKKDGIPTRESIQKAMMAVYKYGKVDGRVEAIQEINKDYKLRKV